MVVFWGNKRFLVHEDYEGQAEQIVLHADILFQGKNRFSQETVAG